jgi:hypothetical protein
MSPFFLLSLLSCAFRATPVRGFLQESEKRTTLVACLQELRKRLQDRHDFRCAQDVAKKDAANAASAACEPRFATRNGSWST